MCSTPPSQPPMIAPRMPMMMSQNQPRPLPRTTRLARNPAMSPTTIVTTMFSSVTELFKRPARLSLPAELNGLHQAADDGDLLRADHVPHARVEADRHGGAHSLEDFGLVKDAFLRDVGVDVAAAEEGRGLVEGAWVVTRGVVRSDQPAAQGRDGAVAARIAGGPLQGQARPLREAEEHDPLRGNGRLDALDELRDHVERRAQDRKSTRLNSSHLVISYAVFCLKKKKI